ncbi:MAG: DUF4386 domain-containing protein [Patescibacteria group bacterium]|nr:DUF4386 domain-containing protein [Patescibacteria group bacterium]
MKINKYNNKTKAIFAGVFILVAYGVLVSGITSSKPLVMISDVISGLAVIGIAVIMFPFFKRSNKKLSLSYLLLKILEGTLMITAGIFFLNNSLQFMRDWIYNGIHLCTFIISGFVFYYLLYKTKLVPQFISVWGAIAILALLVKTAFKIVGLTYTMLDVMLILIITNEMFLAIWLMVKGFNPTVVDSVSINTKSNIGIENYWIVKSGRKS